MVSMTPTQQASFTLFMQKRIAPLMNAAAPFVGRLSSQDREYLLTKALEFAWEQKAKLKQPTDLILWWTGALRSAAQTRKEWTLDYSDGPRVVLGKDLGERW